MTKRNRERLIRIFAIIFIIGMILSSFAGSIFYLL